MTSTSVRQLRQRSLNVTDASTPVLVKLFPFEVNLCLDPKFQSGGGDGRDRLLTVKEDQQLKESYNVNDLRLLHEEGSVCSDVVLDPCAVKDVLLTYLDDEFSKPDAFTSKSSTVQYSPLKNVVVNREGADAGVCENDRRVLEGTEWMRRLDVDGEGGCCTSFYYSGFAIFTKENSEQEVPSSNFVTKVQLIAFGDENGELLASLQGSGEDSGLDHVASVTASLSTIPSTNNGGSSNGGNNSGGSPNTGNTDNGRTASNGGGGSVDSAFDPVILTAIIVAALSMVLLGVALYLAFRRKKKASPAGYFRNPAPTTPSNMSGPGQSSSKKHRGNSAQRETPIAVPVGNNNAADGFENDTSTLGDNTAPSGLYPDNVINDDIQSSLRDYEKQFKGRGSSSKATSSRGRAPRGDDTVGGNTQGGRSSAVPDDESSQSSMVSSTYGYSLDGYSSSVAQSTQYGY